MKLFDRLRAGAARHDESPGKAAVVPTRDAPSLIEEGNALEDARRFNEALACYEAAIT